MNNENSDLDYYRNLDEFTEEFKPIKGYEGLYVISNLGNVKRIVGPGCKKERYIKPHPHGGGYLYVRIYRDGKYSRLAVHRLVMQTFDEGFVKRYPVVFRDSNKYNLSFDNLYQPRRTASTKRSELMDYYDRLEMKYGGGVVKVNRKTGEARVTIRQDGEVLYDKVLPTTAMAESQAHNWLHDNFGILAQRERDKKSY